MVCELTVPQTRLRHSSTSSSIGLKSWNARDCFWNASHVVIIFVCINIFSWFCSQNLNKLAAQCTPPKLGNNLNQPKDEWIKAVTDYVYMDSHNPITDFILNNKIPSRISRVNMQFVFVIVVHVYVLTVESYEDRSHGWDGAIVCSISSTWLSAWFHSYEDKWNETTSLLPRSNPYKRLMRPGSG